MRRPDVCAALASHPRTSDIPVVVVSAGDTPARGSHLAAPNVVGLVATPGGPAAILAAVRNALASRRDPKTHDRAPIGRRTQASTDRSTCLDEGFGLLLSQLEGAALELADAPAPTAVAASLRALHEKIEDVSEHVLGQGVAPYRLRPDGSLAGLASTLLDTHRLLCHATLALTTGKAGIGRRPTTPRTIAIAASEEGRCEEFLAVARNRSDVLVVDRDFGAIPWLVKLIDPALLVVVPTRCPEIREALARIPESRARRILLAGPEDHPGGGWDDFERIDPREALAAGAPDPTAVTDRRITLEVVPR